MEKLVYNAFKVTEDKYQVLLVGPKGCGNYLQNHQQHTECPANPAPLFLLSSLIKSIILISRTGRPEMIIGGSGLVAPILLAIAKITGAKSALLVHGLDLIVDNKFYQTLFLPFIKRVDLIIANSINTSELAHQAGIEKKKISVVNPGVDIPRKLKKKYEARRELNLRSTNILLSVGRLIPRKGLPNFIRYSLPQIIEQHPDTIFIIAGEEPQNALNRNSTSVTEEIHSAIDETGLNSHVKLLGAVDEPTLELLFVAADLFVFPLIEVAGDVEGFGMVAIEAAAHGTPTIAFDCGGVRDAIQDDISGKLVTSGNYEAFAELSAELLRDDSLITADMCRAFAQNFTWAEYGKNLISAFSKTLAV